MQITTEDRLKMRYIPAGYSEYKRDGNSVIYASPDHLHAIAYRGNSRKSEWFYRFNNETGFLDAVTRFFASIAAHNERKAQQKTDRANFRTSLKPGDILEGTWGWEQTNADFFQVIRVTGKCTVVLREIASTLEETGFMQGKRTPIKDAFLKDAKELIKRAGTLGPGREYINMGTYSIYPWDGKPVFCSWYG